MHKRFPQKHTSYPQAVEKWWIKDANIVEKDSIFSGALGISGEKIVDICKTPPSGAPGISVRGAFLLPGLVDLHIWGPPHRLSTSLAKSGTTAFLCALGPLKPDELNSRMVDYARQDTVGGAACLGLHLEGPYLNPERAGALQGPELCGPSAADVRRWLRSAPGFTKMMTLAPELPGSLGLIRQLVRAGVRVSLGHSSADAARTRRAVRNGASLVTHLFNGMPPLDHHRPRLLDVALTEPSISAMLIADGVHVAAEAAALALRAKTPAGIVLVSDNVRLSGWPLQRRNGAYYRPNGVMAGGARSLLEGVRWLVKQGLATVPAAVAMASYNPAHVLGESRRRGRLCKGFLADCVVCDADFRVLMACVGGRIVYSKLRG